MSDRDTDPGGEPPEPTPFSFKLMVAMGVLYLGWRLVESVIAFLRWRGWIG